MQGWRKTMEDALQDTGDRLGILGRWDDPYKTMAFRYQAAIVRAALSATVREVGQRETARLSNA